MNKVKQVIDKKEELIQLLVEQLNAVHNVNYSVRFWNILLDPYITALIYNQSILEKEIDRFAPPNFLFSNTLFISKKVKFFHQVRYFVKILNSVFGSSNLKRHLQNRNQIAMGFHEPNLIINEVDTYIKTIYPILNRTKINKEKRKRITEMANRSETIFKRNMLAFIPKIYVEYFDFFLQKVPLVDPQRKTFHTSIFESFFMRFILAKYTEHGAQLYYYQHGGAYGEYAYKTAYHYENTIADQYMTWGWKMRENDKPYRAFRLEKFAQNFSPNPKKKFDILMIYPIITKNNKQIVSLESHYFFDTINREKYTAICARPRPVGRFNRKSILNFISERLVKIDSGYSKIYKLIGTSRIVVILTHPSTSILECLYVNQPVIALLNNNDFPSDIVKHHYDYLLEKQVLHKNIETIVTHLNTIDLDEWWSHLVNDQGFINFKNEFLRKV